MSKLYTEEQVIKLAKAAYAAGEKHSKFIFKMELDKLTPIELPTDEDIYINSNVNSENTEQHIGFIKGIQLMRELIKNNK